MALSSSQQTVCPTLENDKRKRACTVVENVREDKKIPPKKTMCCKI